jgi:hypothetical protein
MGSALLEKPQKAEKETKEEQCVLSLTNTEIKAYSRELFRDQ